MARAKKEKKPKSKTQKKKLSFKHKNASGTSGSTTVQRKRRRNFAKAKAAAMSTPKPPNTADSTAAAPSFYVDTTPTTANEISNILNSGPRGIKNVIRLSRRQRRNLRKNLSLIKTNDAASASALNTSQNSTVPAADSTQSKSIVNATQQSLRPNFETPCGRRNSRINKSAGEKVRQKWRKYIKNRLRKTSLQSLAGVSPKKAVETKTKILRLLGDKSNELGEFSTTDENDANLLQDLDLVILAASSSDYEAYTKLLRQEYATLNEESYKQMRLKVLETLLMIPNIFSTPEYQAKFEAAARNNLKWEINVLKTQGK